MLVEVHDGDDREVWVASGVTCQLVNGRFRIEIIRDADGRDVYNPPEGSTVSWDGAGSRVWSYKQGAKKG